MSKNTRTPKLVVLSRFGLFGWSFGVTLFHTAAALGMAVTIGPFILGAVIGIGLLVLFVWSAVRLAGHILFGSDPQYQDFISSGGDPYLDFLPPPFNTDSDAQRLGAISGFDSDACPHHDSGDHRSCTCPCCNITVWEVNPGDFAGLVSCWNCSYEFKPPNRHVQTTSSDA